MLSFIQRILQSSSTSPRKRKRSNTFTTEHATSSEIKDLRNMIAENDLNPYPGASTSSEDREKAISEFLGPGDGNADLDPASKRVKQSEDESKKRGKGNGKGSGNGRLSTISERREEEMSESENENGEGDGQWAYNEKRCGNGDSGDEEMVDVDLGLHPQTVHKIESSNDGVVVDQDLWMWKGGNTMQR